MKLTPDTVNPTRVNTPTGNNKRVGGSTNAHPTPPIKL